MTGNFRITNGSSEWHEDKPLQPEDLAGLSNPYRGGYREAITPDHIRCAACKTPYAPNNVALDGYSAICTCVADVERYRPAVQVDLSQIRKVDLYTESLAPVRQCPDRQKAIEETRINFMSPMPPIPPHFKQKIMDEYRKASAWEEAEIIKKPASPIPWPTVLFYLACILLLIAGVAGAWMVKS